MAPTLEQIISKHVDNLVNDVKAHLGEKVSAAIQGSQTAFVRSVTKGPKTKRTAEQMRCRFTENGHRCKERSRGPRFHFLCTKHAEKSAKKPAKK